MITACLIGESLRVGASIELPGLRIRKITRVDQSAGATDAQPRTWTVIEFDADDALAEQLSQALAAALKAEGGWYADFSVDDDHGADHVIVYAHRVFRYRKGDAEGRAQAVAYGRSVGVPEHQLDWGD